MKNSGLENFHYEFHWEPNWKYLPYLQFYEKHFPTGVNYRGNFHLKAAKCKYMRTEKISPFRKQLKGYLP